jgi:Cu(I)/Ag(I) efflux system membrane protein CusA/SilA
MQRIAVPMIGGMISSTLLTLIVIPAIYALVKGATLERARGAAMAGPKAASRSGNIKGGASPASPDRI